ncbi:16S rRNA processing protein RimM [Nitrosospira sp. Nl5]|nr:16S rRNA processing protein RimM [Nitrosospira sp. Nl5]
MQRKSLPEAAKPGDAVEPMVVMGRIIGPFGVLGWVKVFPYTEYVDGLLDYPVWWLGKGDGDWREVNVAGCEVHGSILTAVLEQCADRTAAIRLKGMQVAVPRSQLPALAKSGKDGYYWSDLIGLAVVNLQNEELGKVTGLLETGANDVLQVQSLMKESGRERLIPFVSQVIISVDLDACRIIVDWGVDY